MAKVVHKVFAPDAASVVGMLAIDSDSSGQVELLLQKKTATEMRIYDEAHENYVVLEGSGFKYAEGLPTAGRIEDVTFYNAAGNVCVSISGSSANIKNLAFADLLNFVIVANTAALKGDDNLVGSREGDYLNAGAGNNVISGLGGIDTLYAGIGNDEYTGGGGNDIFAYSGGRDVITDFDPDGGSDNQDIIQAPAKFADYTLTQRGANTLIDFHDGDTIKLLNVSASAIDGNDFFFFF